MLWSGMSILPPHSLLSYIFLNAWYLAFKTWWRGNIRGGGWGACLVKKGRENNEWDPEEVKYMCVLFIIGPPQELDLANPKTFRVFSKPMGAQSEERLLQFQKRYREWEDPTGETPPCHYGTHYSSAMIVASYLIRLEPFTQHFLRLQVIMRLPRGERCQPGIHPSFTCTHAWNPLFSYDRNMLSHFLVHNACPKENTKNRVKIKLFPERSLGITCLLCSSEEELKPDNCTFPDQHFLLLINVDVLPKFLPFL